MLTEDEVRESMRLYSDGKLIREPSASEVENRMRGTYPAKSEEEQKPIQPKKPEDCPICYRVWKFGSLIGNGYAQDDDPEAVAQSVKCFMTSRIAPGMDNAHFHDPPFKILVYRLATVLEVEA